jgi:hypothetical protein
MLLILTPYSWRSISFQRSWDHFQFGLDLIGNVGFGENKRFAGDSDNALIRAATSRGRQLGSGSIGDINANHGKVAIGEFKDVRATDSLGAIFVRVRAEPAKKHGLCIHAAQQSANHGKKARTRYQL